MAKRKRTILERLGIKKVVRYRAEKYFWFVMVIPTVLWWRESVLWVALLSIWALVLSAAAAEEAAERQDNGD